MLSTKTNGRRAFFAIIMVIVLTALCVLPVAGCKKTEEFKVPSDMTREEAALFTAIAKVCPKNENNSKAKYLTFRIEGWSFDTIPDRINEYLVQYCSAGQATMLQFDDAALVEMGYLEKGNGDFYGEDDYVYANGYGKIFTFSLREDQSVESDSCAVSVTGYISDKDRSGYDVELKYENGAWKFVKYSSVWNEYQFMTPKPVDSDDPEK